MTQNLKSTYRGRDKNDILSGESIVVEIIFEILQLFLGLLVEPILAFRFRIFIFSGRERGRLERRRLRRQISEFPLNIIPLRRSSFQILVHEMVIRHCCEFGQNGMILFIRDLRFMDLKNCYTQVLKKIGIDYPDLETLESYEFQFIRFNLDHLLNPPDGILGSRY
ncbi:1-deoxy-D-xylulose 5-phosphate reductoisomerase [Striga asiatica]|uniref:1-deoxy-D-xylulose 5-phosphate reductoisomerase n=1 Tax=Striga asiatica TaxID=4170 RepID=A0A5A7QSN3_STRAF|nr:1-deoxy-D-xylulose 5-phosphate reductoisomerase [Striga asiatica]